MNDLKKLNIGELSEMVKGLRKDISEKLGQDFKDEIMERLTKLTEVTDKT